MFKRHLIPNKIMALILLLVGLGPMWLDRDGTVMAFFAVPIVGLFTAKENYVDL